MLECKRMLDGIRKSSLYMCISGAGHNSYGLKNVLQCLLKAQRKQCTSLVFIRGLV